MKKPVKSTELLAALAFVLATFISIAVAFFSASKANAFERINANTVRIKILSYNVKGLPALINPDWDQNRFGDIGSILGAHRDAGLAPDIVLLQEAFSNRTPELAQNSRYPFNVVGPSSSKIINSGLSILSEFPIEFHQTLLYGDLDCGTWDCFASKGAEIVRLQLPGVPFLLTIANTHVQSDRDQEAARGAQLHDFAVFLASLVNRDLGLLAGGDFNTTPSQKTYQDFVRATNMKDSGELCLTANSGCSLLGTTTRKTAVDRSLDHIFVANGHKVTMKPISVERTFTKPYKGRMLSDHAGYEAVFEITYN